MWDAASGACRAVLTGHAHEVPPSRPPRPAQQMPGLAAHPWAGGAAHPPRLSLKPSPNPKNQIPYPPPRAKVTKLLLCAAHDVLYSASDDYTVRSWCTRTGRCLVAFSGHADVVRCLALSADSLSLYTGSSDGTVRSWRCGDGACSASFEGSGAPARAPPPPPPSPPPLPADIHPKVRCLACPQVRALALSRNGQLLMSGAQSGSVRVWAAQEGRLLSSLPGHTGAVNCIAFCDRSALLYSGSQDRSVCKWQARARGGGGGGGGVWGGRGRGSAGR